MNDEPPLSKEEADARFQSVLDKLDEINSNWSRGVTPIWTFIMIFNFWFLGILFALHLSYS